MSALHHSISILVLARHGNDGEGTAARTDPEADAEDDDVVRADGEGSGLSVVGRGGLVGDGGPAFAVTPHEDEGLVLRYNNFAPAVHIHMRVVVGNHASCIYIIIRRIIVKGKQACVRACAGLSAGGR